MSIPIVSDSFAPVYYHCAMENRAPTWQHWGKRLRLHVREHRIKWADIAGKMDQHESTLRSWCNGTREINLADFFRLCDFTEADSALILYGKPSLTPEQTQKLGEKVAQLFQHYSALNPRYDAISRKLNHASPTAQQKRRTKNYTRAARGNSSA